mmetsp:Transcript_24044/g.31191  ORF Transcript_24044/g.31191 Transcript_24044/m.31191 type:complete len:571 (-) Transcript_24044:387-2099(-)
MARELQPKLIQKLLVAFICFISVSDCYQFGVKMMSSLERPPHVVVVGGGWGGLGASKALLQNGCKVTLIDGIDPTGKTPYLTPTGKPFEAGTRGFWKDYPNIEDLVQSLGLREDEVFTPFTNSSFYSPNGLEATAPVFSLSAFPELPSPLGQVFATSRLFERLPLPDRASIVGLLLAMIDFNRNPEVFEAYDRMTAHELFIRMGLSKRLVDDFLRPTLLVGLFKPPEELSAAVTMELLYFYALAHQTSFDVRWIKKKSISEVIIAPLVDSLLADHGEDKFTIKSGCLVKNLAVGEKDAVSTISYVERSSGESFKIDDVDGCVLALGSRGMKSVVSQSPELALKCPELSKAASLGAIDVVSVRIWLDRTVPTRTPANVFSRFPGLRGAGGTFFMLDQLQNEDIDDLWGGAEPQGSVVACDFYNAGAIQTLSDKDIIALLMEHLLPSAVPEFKEAKVVDSFVQKYPQSVTWFSPGSYLSRPPLKTSITNLMCAGDWVRMGKREHGAKGLCQERAYVSGLEAANALAEVLECNEKPHKVIPIREDEPQVKLGRKINAQVQSRLPKFLQSPWVR